MFVYKIIHQLVPVQQPGVGLRTLSLNSNVYCGPLPYQYRLMQQHNDGSAHKRKKMRRDVRADKIFFG